MMDPNELLAENRREDAKIANFRHLATRAAHLALTNRALATAVLSLDSNVQRYADICSFLDNSALSKIESAANMKLSEPNEEDEDAHEPEDWSGDPGTICSGRTAQGKACTKRASYSHAGTPYCRTHYPYPPEYYEAEHTQRQRWSEYFEERKRLLNLYDELERDVRSLEAMNELLEAAMTKLSLSAKRRTVQKLEGKHRPFESTHFYSRWRRPISGRGLPGGSTIEREPMKH